VTPEQLFDALLTAVPSRPFVTFYDEGSGERSELSVRSLGNWVAKTHFLLTDELGLGVGDSAYVALPAHWISVPALLGCCTAGLALTDSPDDAAVGFVAPQTAATAAGIPDVFAIAPESAAVGFRDAPPAGTADYVAAVRPQADNWATVHFPAGADDPGLGDRTRGAVVAWAQQRASELGVGHGARVLTGRDWHGSADWVDTLFLPLAVGGSVVFVRNAPDGDLLERRAAQERATVRV
jgi:uncharacterized protein (TIGR03089 family)